MSGNSTFAAGVPVVRSFVYIGAPETDPGFQLNVTTNFT